jgi:hypothetical protein
LAANNNFLEWLNGNITGTGTIYVANGASFNVLASASNMAPSLSVGLDGIYNTPQTAISSFVLSESHVFSAPMTGNLAIGASIIIYTKGRMTFAADANQNTAGGIVYAAGNTTGVIRVYGSVTGTADGGGQALTVQPQVIIQSGGNWSEATNEQMKFTYTDAETGPSVDVEGGTLTLQNGANIAVTDPMLLNNNGLLSVPSTPGVTTTATVQGSINDNGNIQLGDANGFAKLNVTVNVDIETGRLTTYVTFNNGVPTASLLNVTGQFAVDNQNNPNSKLIVNSTVNSTPPAMGTNVQIVSAGSTATKSTKPLVFDGTTFNGQMFNKATLDKGYTLTTA